MSLANQVALITGGARGIGKEIATLFAREGADLALFDVNAQVLEQTASELRALGRRVEGLVVDVTDASAVEAAVLKVLDKLSKIDILVNNAGITHDGLIVRMEESQWDRVLDINLKGTFLCTRAVAKAMLKARRGRIVSIASIVGLIGNPGQANYAASKAGVIGMTKSVAKELATRGITCNAIAPGFIKTEMTDRLADEAKQRLQALIPMGTLGEPRDVAQAALFLVSDAARYITGHVLVVDGGLAM
ncbi:MAG: 3-oxoacyl-[acyl-carrier-protein] reductase [Omnitrophica WOR_2 bacterium RIFCSPLOWO2_02_FULL_63_16]|nr:MAG: 3-oxoacyl-[acyl-carrier-protein] reductase [Omnitrophica WOR_2 bacterium GWA2_63_20]OGX18400.1 MAG: 3-oxoacyl-[acyl-carrier-protein] reductase [Omnitrophica WOR_2 bacterium GWF2_63_9]OGX33209.1 MAG: 3-oxoacyl-[acyl-carrier-protein] reductase [Omnitrophica WOR_2 bacterium RIFCSPHIGHO2_12_FULL_64_13]OGX36985.1 MAG: 3-oxoacyl-[acyl-carrier-protein] reductase [Omnitrophica WOR_2 bacterium RIFCSPHIGHO2_02_FULL_63_39]OGX46409.1 MAG: 3-oxoacyl-[acyl-carrier-protein] reductase [Omnitrophica WOR